MCRVAFQPAAIVLRFLRHSRNRASIRWCRWARTPFPFFSLETWGDRFQDVLTSGRPPVQPFSPSYGEVRYDVTAYLSRENRVSVSSVHFLLGRENLGQRLDCHRDKQLLQALRTEGDCERDETIRTQEERRPDFWTPAVGEGRRAGFLALGCVHGQPECLGSRDFQQIEIACEIRDAEIRDSGLSEPHKLASAPQVEILLRDLETVRDLRENLKPRQRLGGSLLGRNENAP